MHVYLSVSSEGGETLTRDGPQMDVKLNLADLNEIKRLDLCTRMRNGNGDCYLYWRDDAVRDMVENQLDGCGV